MFIITNTEIISFDDVVKLIVKKLLDKLGEIIPYDAEGKPYDVTVAKHLRERNELGLVDALNKDNVDAFASQYVEEAFAKFSSNI